VTVRVAVPVLLQSVWFSPPFGSQSAMTEAAKPRTRQFLICMLKVGGFFWVVGSELKVVERVYWE
jgi:hypothetical protein